MRWRVASSGPRRGTARTDDRRPASRLPRGWREGLRPVGPRHLAHIEVAVAVHGQSVRRQEFGRTQAWANPTQAGNALARVVDDSNPWAEVRDVAVDRLHRTEFADVADWAFARRHEQAAGAVQIVPLRLVLAVAVEHLHAMVLAVGHIDPAIGIAVDVVRNIELVWISARPAPGEQQLAVRRVFVHPGVAIAVGHIDVALRGHRSVSAAMERLATHVWSRLAGDAEG